MTGPPDLWSSWRLRPVSYRNTYQHTVPTPMQNLSLPGDVGINSKSFQASWYRLRRVFVARLQTLRHSANYKSPRDSLSKNNQSGENDAGAAGHYDLH